jgi:polysaccharide biosynthesis protein PslJ
VTSAAAPAPISNRLAAAGAIGLLGALTALAASILLGRSSTVLLAVVVLGAATVPLLISRTALSWRNLLTAIIVVVLVIPIRRFTLPAALPFQLEPYRVLIALIGLAWLASLLVDPRVKFVRGPLFAPVVTIVLVCAASIVYNAGRIQTLNVSSDVAKQFTFLLSFIVVFFLIVSVIRRFDQIDFLLQVLVGGGAVVAAFALVELWTGLNVFNHVDRIIPFLKWTAGPTEPGLVRAGRLRVMASAQHPIGLGELLVLLIPMAIYVAAVTRRKRWLAAALLLGLGAFATVSRTAVVSLVVIAAVYVVLRPGSTFKFWPLVVPAIAAVHIAMPGTLGSLYKGIFPKQGLIAEEAGAPVGSSRTASFGPGFEQVKLRPLLGGGYGTRIPTGPKANSFIVDDQWLSTAMELGVAGVFAWAWLFVRFIRKMFRAARRDRTDRGWFFVGLAATSAGFAVGMATYDSFSFIQATLVLFILLAVGCAGLRAKEDEEVAREHAPA